MYKSLANGGKEDFGTNGITMNSSMTIRGGYAGWVSGSTFDWVTRTPRSSDIDLTGANTRAFYSSGAKLAMTIDGFTIRNGGAAGGGGAIKAERNIYTTLSLSDCLFTNNTATTEDGGAVVATATYLPNSIVNCDFLDNRAPSTAVVPDGRGQKGGRGGALFVELEFGSQCLMTNCTFRGNTCGRQGGALAMDLHNARADSLTARNCVFESNSSANGGGAIFSADGWGNTPTLEKCVFRGNSAAADGAAIGGSEYWQGDYVLRNCLIAGNTGNYAVMHDGWRSDEFALDIAHCTIVANPGGGIYCNPHDFGAGLRIRDSIVANNGETGVSYVRGKLMAAAITYSDIVGQKANCAGDAAAGDGCISRDPRFVSAAAKNYRLTAASPCKDAGVDIGVRTDLDGVARPQGAGCDMGAFEFADSAAAGDAKRTGKEKP